jgi:ADP-ribosylation factor-like protein 3
MHRRGSMCVAVFAEHEALLQVLDHPATAGLPLLLYATKQDLGPALALDQLQYELGLQHLRDRVWHLQPCNGITGDGVMDGLLWLTRHIQEPHPPIADKA